LRELQERAKQREIPPYWMAMIYHGLGEKEETYDWLEKALAERSFWLLWLKTEPLLDEIRSEPRFQNLLRKVNFPS
jgi:hypothetical protein